jgi:hypothetical protein
MDSRLQGRYRHARNLKLKRAVVELEAE